MSCPAFRQQRPVYHDLFADNVEFTARHHSFIRLTGACLAGLHALIGPLAICSVCCFIGRYHRFVLISNGVQHIFRQNVLAGSLHVVLVNAGLNDRIHGAGLFAKSAIDALEEIDVIACRTPQAIGARIRINGYGERRADRLTKLAGNTPFLAIWVAPQGMQTPESRRLRRLLFRILYRYLHGKKIAQGHTKPLQELPQQKRLH